MASIPQLRKDIAELQDEVKRLRMELIVEKAKPPVIKEVAIKGTEKIVYRDNPKHIEMIRRLQGGTAL